MPPKSEPTLQDIVTALRAQEKALKEIQASLQKGPPQPKRHWKFMIIIAIITLAAGSAGAYQYYKILQSIINQFPS
jgi:hypothetical protein